MNRKKALRIGIYAGLATVTVSIGLAIFMNLWVRRMSAPYLADDLGQLAPRQVAIVPGAQVWPDGTPSQALADRLTTALDLYRSGKVSKILVSGDHGAPEYDEVNAMWRWLAERGVAPRDLFLDHAGFRTLDTMARARQVFQVERAVICTQAFHLPRSVFLARRAGIDAVGLPADRRIYEHRIRDQFREFVATCVAFMDSYVFGTQPRHLGAPIPIAGDGRLTHDRWTGP